MPSQRKMLASKVIRVITTCFGSIDSGPSDDDSVGLLPSNSPTPSNLSKPSRASTPSIPSKPTSPEALSTYDSAVNITLETSPVHLRPPTSFLSLPPEIRILIYAILVVPSRVYFSKPSTHEYFLPSPRYADLSSTPPPSLAIFRTCRKIHDEAEHEYATRNTFVLPSSWAFRRPSELDARPLMSARAWSSVRKLSLSFDTSAMVLADVMPDTTASMWARRWRSDGTVTGRLWAERSRELHATHNLMTTYTLNRLVDKMRDLYVMIGDEGLRYLEVDVASAFCPMADHRLVEFVVQKALLKQIREQDASEDETEAFYIADLGRVEDVVQEWRASMKCNPDSGLLQKLGRLGVNFDCASLNEMRDIYALDVASSRVVFTNPIKSVASLKYARTSGADLLVFDNSDELVKVKQHHPNVRLLLRITVDDREALVRFGDKFGAKMAAAGLLFEKATQLGLNIVGTCFHIGSGSSIENAYRNAITEAAKIFHIAARHGHKFTILDIGGGFVNEGFAQTSTEINVALRSFHDTFPGVQIIAEPGRLFARDAFMVVAQVVGRRGAAECTQSDSGRSRLYLNDGVFGNFMNAVYEKPGYQPIALVRGGVVHVQKGELEWRYSLWGPTCDSLDCIDKGVSFDREIEMGDWLVFDKMGAYSSCCQTNFNGFQASTKTVYV
ncbi:hypothetical protein EJ05DRAFT_500288 [Pseudovirgaria hyperparasitica]|uniref:Orn/DAP/Arg decarboxylase 2 N-terminal domain-containing protein n=1 Tax=Pseudovirgaria hyperparasitica TaxID=470096 RepID=A0A6A6W9A0_9PEZI|nr:uncharacterized protein EJ05DRAFT_500288 [Pseudovirgaria hyperparasitica]KAF2758769.1 hypothetical protein EJ05DRAFT_500288 [Pseudovirgaria hyperparasitica]